MKAIKKCTDIKESVQKIIDTKSKELLPEEFQNINRRYAYSLLCLVQSFSIVIFVYFTYTTYTQQMKSVFLELDRKSGNCKDVAKPITFEFYGSYTGSWSGADTYKQNEGLYRLQLSNLFVDGEGFAELLQKFHDEYLVPLGKEAKLATSEYNVLKHLFYEAKINQDGYIQKLDFLTDPQVFFAGSKFFGLLNRDFLFTGIPESMTYDRQTAKTIYKFDMDAISKEEEEGIPSGQYGFVSNVCLMNKTKFNDKITELNLNVNDWNRYIKSIDYIGAKRYFTIDQIVPSKLLGYNQQYGPIFTLEFDHIELTAALAVNLGILPFEDLIDSGIEKLAYQYKGVMYELGYYSVDKYNFMTPIVCLERISGSDPTAENPFEYYCFYKLGSFAPDSTNFPMLGIVSFMNMGYNPKNGLKGTKQIDFYFPDGPLFLKCVCPMKKFYEVDMFYNPTSETQAYECNKINYMSSLAFFPDANDEEIFYHSWLYSSEDNYYFLLALIAQCPKFDVSPEQDVLARACHISKYEIMLVNYETFLFGKQIGPLIDMATKYLASELNEIIYNSSMPSVGPLRQENEQGTECNNYFQGYYDNLYKNYDSFSFCEDCTIMTTVNEGGYLDGFTMNSFLRQEPFMSCNDTFTVSSDVLSLLKEISTGTIN